MWFFVAIDRKGNKSFAKISDDLDLRKKPNFFISPPMPEIFLRSDKSIISKLHEAAAARSLEAPPTVAQVGLVRATLSAALLA